MVKCRVKKKFTKTDYCIAKDVIEMSIRMKQDQVRNEPDEPMWKTELAQLFGAKESVTEDEESVIE